MTLTSTSNAHGYAVRRHDDAVLRGAVGAEDDGARIVIHNSINTFGQMVASQALDGTHGLQPFGE